MKELLCSNRTSIKDPEMKKLYPKVMEELFARYDKVLSRLHHLRQDG